MRKLTTSIFFTYLAAVLIGLQTQSALSQVNFFGLFGKKIDRAETTATTPVPDAPTTSTVETQTLADAILERRSHVEHFKVVGDVAKSLGIRVWIWGGNSVGYAHYVKSEIISATTAGSKGTNDLNFTYDFDEIYPPGSDFDLVIDGDAKKCEEFKKALEKSSLAKRVAVWDIRPLSHNVPGPYPKEALLGNPEFMNQHNDSASMGFIELTDPPNSSEPAIRELKNWTSHTSDFLDDVAAGRIRFYHSSKHKQTERFTSGRNPEIFSVVRFLVKAGQFGLTISDIDMARIKKMVEEFNPATFPYQNRGWIERKGKKIVNNAISIERSLRLLSEVGLRDKLIAISDNSKDSLGWWLSKKPLPTKDLGRTGRTAGEIGIKTVAHATKSPHNFWSLLRNADSHPNALESRPGVQGELAVYGEGFYVMEGEKGAFETPYTVKMNVDPNAREGIDFKIHAGTKGNYLITFHNRNALWYPRLAFGEVSYLKYWHAMFGMIPMDSNQFEELQRKFRRFQITNPNPDPKDLNEMVSDLKAAFKESFESWQASRSRGEYVSAFQFKPFIEISKRSEEPVFKEMNAQIAKWSYWEENPGAILQMWGHYKMAADILAAHPNQDSLLQLTYKFTHEPFDYRSRLSESQYLELARRLLLDPRVTNQPELMLSFLENKRMRYEVYHDAMKSGIWDNHPDLINKWIEVHWLRPEELFEVLRRPAFSQNPQILAKVIRTIMGRDDYPKIKEMGLKYLEDCIVSKPIGVHPKVLIALIETQRMPQEFLKILSNPHMKGNAEVMIVLFKTLTNSPELRSWYGLFENSFWSGDHELMQLLAREIVELNKSRFHPAGSFLNERNSTFARYGYNDSGVGDLRKAEIRKWLPSVGYLQTHPEFFVYLVVEWTKENPTKNRYDNPAQLDFEAIGCPENLRGPLIEWINDYRRYAWSQDFYQRLRASNLSTEEFARQNIRDSLLNFSEIHRVLSPSTYAAPPPALTPRATPKPQATFNPAAGVAPRASTPTRTSSNPVPQPPPPRSGGGTFVYNLKAPRHMIIAHQQYILAQSKKAAAAAAANASPTSSASATSPPAAGTALPRAGTSSTQPAPNGVAQGICQTMFNFVRGKLAR